jgi:hypothetical protein
MVVATESRAGFLNQSNVADCADFVTWKPGEVGSPVCFGCLVPLSWLCYAARCCLGAHPANRLIDYRIEAKPTGIGPK